MNDVQAQGNELLEFVKTLGELDWAKFQARRPTIAIQGSTAVEDRSAQPPYTSFRFQNEDPAVTEKLREAVASYRGEVRWVMTGHDRSPLPGTNWTVAPQQVEALQEEASSLGLSARALVEQRMPEFGPKAFEDLLGLVRHVKTTW